MKSIAIILASSILFLTSCRNDKDAEQMLDSGLGWGVERFYVNGNDETDSLLSIITPTQGPPFWRCNFSSDHTLSWNVSGSWSFTNKDASVIRITAYNQTSNQVGPLLGNGIPIFWDFNYDKLCNDDEIWITTNYNNKSYEVHFYRYQQ